MTLRMMLVAGALTASVMVTMPANASPEYVIVPHDEVRFQPLNPLRGDASPRAGVLWGDIKQDLATGTLIKFRDGFSSPPHIHNITYRAVVIRGEVHNDDPDAVPMWMGPGSFWTQPAGESHITSAQGEDVTAFLEIMEGPYLVRPSGEAFDNGERPVNVEARNIIWLSPSHTHWLEIGASGKGAELAFLWGTPEAGQRHGTFLRLPAGFQGQINGDGDWLRAVVIKGTVAHAEGQSADETMLKPGSLFGAIGAAPHRVTCGSAHACQIYITAKGTYRVTD